MNRRSLLVAAVLGASSLSLNLAKAGKGWCRSDPIIIIDGIRYQILVATTQPRATFVYVITYVSSAEVVTSHKNDTFNFVEADNFSVGVQAFDEDGNEIDLVFTVQQLGG